jgi:hypothetical protein
MGKERYYKILFIIAGLYDFILGFGFCFFCSWLHQNVLLAQLPDPPIYFQVCAAFIGMIGIGYFLVWKHLYRNVDLVKIGTGMKLIYILGAIWFSTYAVVPMLLVIFGIIDVVFIIAFIEFLRYAKVNGKIPA